MWAAPHYTHLIKEVELVVDWTERSIPSSYYQNCLVRVAHLPRGVTWWNKELRDLKTQTRRHYNRAKITG